MKLVEKYERVSNVEAQTVSRLLLIVLIILGLSCIFSAIVFPKIAWVFVIFFLYILALEIILLTSD